MPSSGERVLLYRATNTNEADAWAECRKWRNEHVYKHDAMLVQVDDSGRWWVTGLRDSKKGATDGKQD